MAMFCEVAGGVARCWCKLGADSTRLLRAAASATRRLPNPLCIFRFNDGALPLARVVFGPDGLLYGTTSMGGNDSAGNLYGTTIAGGDYGGGIVYELSPSNGGWTTTTLYNFSGSYGSGAVLVMDAAGSLYGTTVGDGAYGQGNVFKLTLSDGQWIYTLLYDFTGGSDGGQPWGQVTLDASGNLYGTASTGGANNAGVVWEITP